MGIQPIDLQTLYTQLDKVSKSVVQQQGAALQNSIVMDAKSLRDLEKTKTVEESKQDEKMNGVKDGKGNSPEQENKKNDKKEAESEEKQTVSVIKDPALGKKIDISG